MIEVFITRALNPTYSHLGKWAEATGNEVTGRSLLTFAAVRMPERYAGQDDWWFFYSPRAVEYGLPYLPNAERSSRPAAKIAAMGLGTARAIRAAARGFRAEFVGSGTPAEVAAAFGEVAAGQRVFFPRAKQSRLTVQTLLADRITVEDAVCYDNQAVPADEHIAADVYVFTSPLNVSAYLDHQELSAGARVIAIGPSTGGALAARGVVHEVAATAGEEGVVALL